jgi:hypothetical protein
MAHFVERNKEHSHSTSHQLTKVIKIVLFVLFNTVIHCRHFNIVNYSALIKPDQSSG